MRKTPSLALTIALFQPIGGDAAADDGKPQNGEQKSLEQVLEEQTLRMSEQISVVGSAHALDRVPGSAYVVEPEELDRQKQGLDDVHRILRQVPGITIQEEEGFGLRPNIGMRGSGSERSAKITLMEDGILIAPAPYAAPSAYYFPVTGRMQSIEVRKGSSQIQFGPRTNGGVLNLISAPVPSRFTLDADVAAGQNAALKSHFRIGDSGTNVGFMFETYQLRTNGFKQLDGGGSTGFHTQDYLGKLRFHTGPSARLFQSVELKLGAGAHDGDATYLGLTDADFERRPSGRYRASSQDNIQWDHQQLQLQHFITGPNGLALTTTAYRNTFQRNWYKLQSILGTGLAGLFEERVGPSRALDIARGADSRVDDLKVRANNRTYFSQGVRSVAGVSLRAGSTEHSLAIGLRIHADEEDRLQWEDGFQMLHGIMRRTSVGVPGSQTNRVSGARAVALFVHDTIEWSRFALLPGLRYETIDLTREDFSRSDPERGSGPTRTRETPVSAWIPGIGITFEVAPRIRLVGGIHKGFSPPGPGATSFTEPEESVNAEAGLRASGRRLSTEVLFFHSGYSNLLGADTLAGGGTGEGNLVNGGQARALGIEAGLTFDFSPESKAPFRIPFQASYTYTDAVFRNAFDSDYAPWGSVEVGDKLPYLAPHQLYLSLDLETDRWVVGANLSANARMRTVAGQGALAPSHATDAFVTVNLSGEVDVSKNVRLFANVQNITDSTYVVARRPAGARPGLPRTLMLGLKLRVGR